MTTLTRTAMSPGQVFTGTPEQILAEIIATFEGPVAAFIASRLACRDRQLVEDLTQDTFVHLWRYHLAKGHPIDDRVYGLLCRIGSQMLCHHLRRLRSTEIPVDLTDPAQTAARTPAAASGDTPHLAVLFADLESAKGALTEAADQYKAAAKVHTCAVNGLTRAVRPAAVLRCTERANRTGEDTQRALSAFKDAADRVAEARAAWNGAAADHTARVVTR